MACVAVSYFYLILGLEAEQNNVLDQWFSKFSVHPNKLEGE